MLKDLIKLANKLDGINDFDLASQIDYIISIATKKYFEDEGYAETNELFKDQKRKIKEEEKKDSESGCINDKGQ